MKTIGVLGGIGPQATMEFEAYLHTVAQRLIPPSANSGYPPLIVYYCRQAPILLTAEGPGHPVLPLQADPRLLAAATALGRMADFLVLTSNTPHRFAAVIERAAGRPLLSMVELVVEDVVRRQPRLVGVLEASGGTLYHVPLMNRGLVDLYLPEAAWGPLDAAIFALMEGRVEPEGRALAREAVSALRAKGADAIILGCTELPLLLGDESEAPDLINPTHVLAEAAVRHSMQ